MDLGPSFQWDLGFGFSEALKRVRHTASIELLSEMGM